MKHPEVSMALKVQILTALGNYDGTNQVAARFDPAYLGQLDEAGLTLTALGSDQTAVHQVRDAAGDIVGLLMPMRGGGMRPVDLTQAVKDAYTRLTEHSLYLSPAGRWRVAAICAGVVPS